MTFGGWQKFSLIDYPGKVAAVVFTIGCNFRCPFCHNPELITGGCPEIPETEVLSHLKNRKGKLDGLVITGGEPLIHRELPDFLRRVRELGFQVKLDTNGTFPDRLSSVINAALVDFIAMDIKAPKEKYPDLAGTDVDFQTIRDSIRIIEESGLPHLFRTTVPRPLLDLEDLTPIRALLRPESRYTPQPFIRTAILDPNLPEHPQYSAAELEKSVPQPCTE